MFSKFKCIFSKRKQMQRKDNKKGPSGTVGGRVKVSQYLEASGFSKRWVPGHPRGGQFPWGGLWRKPEFESERPRIEAVPGCTC